MPRFDSRSLGRMTDTFANPAKPPSYILENLATSESAKIDVNNFF
jgi:hypothetical protein